MIKIKAIKIRAIEEIMWTESTEIEIALMVTFAVTTMTLMTVVKGAI